MRWTAPSERVLALRIGAALASGALFVAAACQVVVPLEDVPRASTDATVADAPANDAASGHPACGPIPSRPDASGSGPSSSRVFATVAWDLSNDGDPHLCDVAGFNLDGLATRGERCEVDRACAPRIANDVRFETSSCDLEDGVDNALFALRRAIASNGAINAIISQYPPSLFLTTGVTNVLVELSEWNGLDDDDDVRVAIYTTAGYRDANGVFGPDASDDGGPPSLDVVRALPRVWDGGQSFSWVVEERSVDAVRLPRQINAGYVRERVLVVPETGSGTLPLSFPGGPSVTYRSGALMAYLERDGASDRVRLTHGRIVARASNAGLLTTLAGVAAPYNGNTGALCESQNRPIYESLRDYVCGHLDLPAAGAANDETKPCSDFSIGVLFEAVQSEFAYDVIGGGQRVVAVAPNRFVGTAPCEDPDAGKVFCDDCDWPTPGTCDAGADR